MIKKVFYVVVGAVLALNIWSNFNSYYQAKAAIEIGDLVSHSFQVLRAEDAAKLSIIEFQKNDKPITEVRENLRRLSAIMVRPEFKEKAARLTELSDQQLAAKGTNSGLAMLEDLETVAYSLLQQREAVDRRFNELQLRSMIVGSVVDSVLIVLFFILYFYERSVAAGMQRALASALSHVQSVNQSLLRKLLMKDSIFKTTVHDLKNPLGSIKGFAELLADETSSNSSALEITQIIQRISNNTLTLVGSLLKADDESDVGDKEAVHVIDCVKDVCSFLDPIAKKKDQRIVFEKKTDDFTIWSSHQPIQDVFYNIIGNALKFSPSGTKISVSCVDEGGFHTVQVKDQGQGFTQNDLSMLFIPGNKLSAKPTGGEDSTGIGLYSAKIAIEKIHGSIEINNNADRGARVTIRFPITESKIAPSESLHS